MLVLPALLLVLGLLVALGTLFVESLRPGVDAPGVTLAQYQRIVGTPLYLGHYYRSFGLAAVATAGAILLGYPVAYYLAHAAPALRRAVFALLVLTFFSDYVLRMFGIILVLGSNGLINQLAVHFGFPGAPWRLMFNAFGIEVGLVSASLPFAIITISGVLTRIDVSQVAAARLLGASEWRAFWNVTLPLSLPGVVGAGTLVFLLSLNSFITPALLGGGFIDMVATFIYNEALGLYNLPLGAAASFILFVFSLSLLGVVNGLFGRFGRRFGIRSGR